MPWLNELKQIEDYTIRARWSAGALSQTHLLNFSTSTIAVAFMQKMIQCDVAEQGSSSGDKNCTLHSETRPLSVGHTCVWVIHVPCMLESELQRTNKQSRSEIWLTGVTFIEKRWLSSAACVTSFIYLFSYVHRRDQAFFFSSLFLFYQAPGLVLVYDNKVVYLLGYAPVSSFCDPPSPFKMSSWMVKNPSPSFY